MTAVSQTVKAALWKSIIVASKVQGLRYLMYQVAILSLDPSLRADQRLAELDRIYTLSRRQLYQRPEWRQGPARIHEVASEGYRAISRYTSIHNKICCDLGCGSSHPYGISVVMFLNGATSTVALDQDDAEKQRAAEAIADLLCDCFCSPGRWNWSGTATEDFLKRAQQFDLDALRAGRLDDGLRGLPLNHVVTDIHNPAIEEDSIDIMTSRAVLEHFLDFRVAVDRLFALMRSGGVAFHHIDLVDHRAYYNSKYHYWSFLAENEDWSDGLVNRLRASEIQAHFERAGFEILEYEKRIGQMPKGFRDRIKGRFREMPEEELNVTGVLCVLKKP